MAAADVLPPPAYDDEPWPALDHGRRTRSEPFSVAQLVARLEAYQAHQTRQLSLAHARQQPAKALVPKVVEIKSRRSTPASPPEQRRHSDHSSPSKHSSRASASPARRRHSDHPSPQQSQRRHSDHPSQQTSHSASRRPSPPTRHDSATEGMPTYAWPSAWANPKPLLAARMHGSSPAELARRMAEHEAADRRREAARRAEGRRTLVFTGKIEGGQGKRDILGSQQDDEEEGRRRSSGGSPGKERSGLGRLKSVFGRK